MGAGNELADDARCVLEEPGTSTFAGGFMALTGWSGSLSTRWYATALPPISI
jgi:hypothetical protein